MAGLLSDRPLADVLTASRALGEAVRGLGVTFPAPIQTLSFLALSVIPALKITDQDSSTSTGSSSCPLPSTTHPSIRRARRL